jgi:hypothetical protein
MACSGMCGSLLEVTIPKIDGEMNFERFSKSFDHGTVWSGFWSARGGSTIQQKYPGKFYISVTTMRQVEASDSFSSLR